MRKAGQGSETPLRVPPDENWRTTDQDEINRRKRRAASEPMTILNRTPAHPVFSNFNVTSRSSGQTYQVEVREISPRVGSCTCPDFRVNDLGTCKHLERVIRELACGEPLSDRIDVVPDRVMGRLLIERNLNRLPAALRPYFDITGLALPEFSPTEILEACERVGLDVVRVSQDVEPWMARLARQTERIRLRRAYEHAVCSGHYPPQETLEPLLPYQREGMLHLAFTGRALLADEMGLGKAVQAVAAVALLYRLGEVRHAVAVVPEAHQREWEGHIRRYTALSCETVAGDRAARRRAYEQKAAFTLVSYEQVLRDSRLFLDVLNPECVILDEAQRIRNWNTRTAQTLKQIESRYLFVLTGAPLEQRLDELYTLMSLIDPEVLGPLFRFNREFYTLDEDGRPTGYQNLHRLRERIRPYVLQRRRTEVETELPDRTERVVYVPMAPEQRDRYATHETQATLLAAQSQQRALTRSETERLRREIAMMRMLCDTPYITDETSRVCPKLEELRNAMESVLAMSGVKVLVCSEWERMLQLVRALCEQQGWGYAWHVGSVPQGQRKREIRRFRNEPACRVFLATDAGCPAGSLSQASVVIQCDVPWTAARFEQRIARVCHSHQVRSVTVLNLVAADSIEARLLEQLKQGRANGAAVGARVSLTQRLATLLPLTEATERTPVEHPSFEALRALDPELGFAAALAERMGEKLVACDVWHTEEGRPVFLLAAEGPLRVANLIADRLAADWFAHVAAGPVLEVVAPGVSDVLRRFMDKGWLRMPHPVGARTLYQRGQGLSRPRMMPDDEQARILELREQAGQAFRQARRLMRQLAFDAARAPLELSMVLLARAFARQHRLAEPRHARQTLTEPYAELWGDLLPVLREGLQENSPVALSRALMAKFGR
ncbi:MAG TPA: DEAD/DEAH box helicase [Kiritimatiellia bacterium]|nr:DEAD/DEAH box helicase [Kiritimatiellia bacterium]